MEIPFSRWYSAIPHRRSRRRFSPKPIESRLLAHLNTVCMEFRPFPDARTVFVPEPPDDVFKGAVGPYGKVKGAHAFIAFIGDMDSSHVQEAVGYSGEGIILEATALNLATCWVGGFFKPNVAASLTGTTGNEMVLAVTPIGYANESQSIEERIMTGFGWTHRRKPMANLVSGFEEANTPEWIRVALEAARLAPSAVNRQPWRFQVEQDALTVSVNRLGREFNISKRLDCGIAMLHIEVAALNSGVHGNWDLLESPQVARFTTQ